MIGFFVVSMFDADFRLVVTKPDNVPIVGMLFLIPFFTWFSMREAVRNDQAHRPKASNSSNRRRRPTRC